MLRDGGVLVSKMEQSARASHTPARWLAETHRNLIENHGVYADMRVKIEDYSTGELLMICGGLWHKWLGEYVSDADAQEYMDSHEITTVWRLNSPQRRLFSAIPLLTDRERMYPIQEILLRGGRRSGKTEGAVMLSLAWSIMFPFSKIGICAIDLKSANEMFGKIEYLLPDHWIQGRDQQLNILYLVNGTSLHFNTSRAYKKAGRSYSFDLVLLDEPPTYDRPAEVLTGYRGAIVEYDGCIVAIYTPPEVHETFYAEERKSRSLDPEISGAVKCLYFGSTFDNVCLNEKSKRKLRSSEKTMSAEEAQRELYGKWARSTGSAFPDWDHSLNVISAVPEYLVDITTEYLEARFEGGENWEWICGMDFNETPMSMTISKLYWDPSGGTMVQHYELYRDKSNAQKFIHSDMLPWLRSQYPDISDPYDLAGKILIVADASAWWQGENAGKTALSVYESSASVLRSHGFHCVQPAGRMKRTRSKANDKTHIKNPLRKNRLESMRSRICDYYNYRHAFILDSCPKTIECIEQIELKSGLPDVKSAFAHGYDAASYPLYKLYPKLQLVTDDLDNLNKTYHFVHEIGQRALTEAQRMAHPICQALGKDIVL